MLKYVIKNISDISAEEYAACYNCMNPERRKKVDRFKNESQKKCTLAGEWLSRQLLAEATGNPAESFDIFEDERGKPHAEGIQNIFFNISHSKNIVVSVISDTPVGADIEVFHAVPLKLAKKFCNIDELCYILGKSPTDVDFEKTASTDQLRRLFEIWTIKEAYFKCIGTGITEFNIVNALSSDFNKTKVESDDYIIHFVTAK